MSTLTATGTSPPPSSNSAHKHYDGVEPDDEWKKQLKDRIEGELKSMVKDAKDSMDNKLRQAPIGHIERERLAEEHSQAMSNIRKLAAESFQIALERERQERRWAAGQQMHSAWSEALIQEQQGILDRIQQSGSQNETSHPRASDHQNEVPIHLTTRSAPATNSYMSPSPPPPIPPPPPLPPPLSEPKPDQEGRYFPPPSSRRGTDNTFNITNHRDDTVNEFSRHATNSQPTTERPHPESWTSRPLVDEPQEMDRPKAPAERPEVPMGRPIDRPSRSTSERHVANSPPKAIPEFWKPSISPEEDAAASKPYVLARRGSTASMRSIGSTNLRPPTTNPIPEHATSIDIAGSAEREKTRVQEAEQPWSSHDRMREKERERERQGQLRTESRQSTASEQSQRLNEHIRVPSPISAGSPSSGRPPEGQTRQQPPFSANRPIVRESSFTNGDRDHLTKSRQNNHLGASSSMSSTPPPDRYQTPPHSNRPTGHDSPFTPDSHDHWTANRQNSHHEVQSPPATPHQPDFRPHHVTQTQYPTPPSSAPGPIGRESPFTGDDLERRTRSRQNTANDVEYQHMHGRYAPSPSSAGPMTAQTLETHGRTQPPAIVPIPVRKQSVTQESGWQSSPNAGGWSGETRPDHVYSLPRSPHTPNEASRWHSPLKSPLSKQDMRYDSVGRHNFGRGEFSEEQEDDSDEEYEDSRQAGVIRREEEARRKEEEAVRKEEEARRKEDEARRKEEEAKRRDEEATRKAEAVRQKEEETRKKEEEIRRREEEVKRREEDLNRREAEARRKEEEKQRKEDEKQKQQQQEFRKREEEIRRRAEERKRQDSVGAESHWSGSTHSSTPPSSSGPSWSAPHRSSNAGSPSPSTDRNNTSTSSRSATAGSNWSSSTRANSTTSTQTSGNTRPPTTPTGATNPRTASMGAGASPTGPGPQASAPSPDSEWARRQAEQARKQQEQFRREQERMERERQAKAGKILSKEEVVQLFEAHERQWSKLITYDELRWDTLPWPMLKKPSVPEDITSGAIHAYILSPHYPEKDKSRSTKDRIKEHIRRWHPDRFETKMLTKVIEGEKEKVKEGAGSVVRNLNDLLTRSNVPSMFS